MYLSCNGPAQHQQYKQSSLCWWQTDVRDVGFVCNCYPRDFPRNLFFDWADLCQAEVIQSSVGSLETMVTEPTIHAKKNAHFERSHQLWFMRIVSVSRLPFGLWASNSCPVQQVQLIFTYQTHLYDISFLPYLNSNLFAVATISKSSFCVETLKCLYWWIV